MLKTDTKIHDLKNKRTGVIAELSPDGLRVFIQWKNETRKGEYKTPHTIESIVDRLQSGQYELGEN